MKSIMLLGLAWAVVICATPSLADHFQSQAVAATSHGQSRGRVPGQGTCQQGNGQMVPARFDRIAQLQADRDPAARQFNAGFTTYCD